MRPRLIRFGDREKYAAQSKVRSLLVTLAVLGTCATAQAAEGASVLVFSEPGFPAADSVPPTAEQLAGLLPEAKLVRAADNRFRRS